MRERLTRSIDHSKARLPVPKAHRFGYPDPPWPRSSRENLISALFQLHERLTSDCYVVARLTLSRVLLMDDAAYPWLILVPERPGLGHLHDLVVEDLPTMMQEIARASRVLEDLFRPDKINVAAIGNKVPQLHVHVVARFTTDPAWPDPIWGAAPRQPYSADALGERTAALRAAFAAD